MYRAQYDPKDFLYTDKVAFTIGDHSQQTYVFRRPSEMLDEDKTHGKKPTFRHLMVWGAIAYGFKPPLFLIPQNADTPPIYPPPINPPANPRRSSLNQVKYAVWLVQGLIGPYVEALQSMGRNPVVVEDGAKPHDGEVPERVRQALNIVRFPHPAHSPDLNAIENVWSILKRRVEARRPVARSRSELETQVMEEWALIPMEDINAACLSIAKRVQEVRDAGGYATGH